MKPQLAVIAVEVHERCLGPLARAERNAMAMGVMRLIVNSVGNGAANLKSDVRVVQELLNRCITYLIPVRLLKVDGDCGPITIGVILEFQRRVMGLRSPSGRIDPGQAAIRKLNQLATNPAGHRPVRPDLTGRLLVLAQSIHERIAATIRSLWGNSRGSITLKETDYQRGASLLGTDLAVIKAVARVERRRVSTTRATRRFHILGGPRCTM